MSECEPPFWKNISVIFNKFSLQYKPECKHSPFNFAVRIMLISLIVGMIASVLAGLSALIVTLMFGIITSLIIIFTTKPPEKVIERKPVDRKPVDVPGYVSPIEGFINGSREGNFQPIMEVDAFPYSGQMLPDYTQPTSKNLFMNVLLDEIKYNPDRPEAAPINNVKQTMDDYFRVQWFSDPTDVFGKNQSQRQFITQPSTTVPNNQGAFANWLYKIPGKTCKEGGRAACLSGTDGGSVPWLSQAS